MLATLAIIILCASIFLFFLQEFMALGEKLRKIPGVLLFVPLIVISWLVERYEPWIEFYLHWAQRGLHQSVSWLESSLPNFIGRHIFVCVLHIFLLSIIPILGALFSLYRKPYRVEFGRVYYWGLLLWVIGVILLIIEPI